ncbi:putative fibroblast growth factor 1 [Erpetoichthys calabaricus]|uniref:putative fibroblast growth factor 1 n=1 Tax=Erpetoichthys calabaricus TaxID=27687 RepID=UPI002234D3A4|nr:putative fibroblast growth factor 1 [Erpetoichthys calabaricus]
MSESNITVLMTLPENCSLENYKKPRHLYCWNGGYFLRILPSGVIDGFRERNDKYVQLQVTAEGFGMVSIKGTESGRFLAMGADGHLYGSRTATDECVFLETLEENHYNTYKSHKYQDKNWYVGIKKNGSCKTGPKTHIGQKSIFFLPLSIDN